jgi:hypothetical protein
VSRNLPNHLQLFSLQKDIGYSSAPTTINILPLLHNAVAMTKTSDSMAQVHEHVYSVVCINVMCFRLFLSVMSFIDLCHLSYSFDFLFPSILCTD